MRFGPLEVLPGQPAKRVELLTELRATGTLDGDQAPANVSLDPQQWVRVATHLAQPPVGVIIER